jgi:Short C-terminal domain
MIWGIRAVIGAAVLVLTVGCAHPIKVAPDTTRLQRVSSTSSRIVANVGYYIPKEVSSVEITTQGGGGDNVRYFPYEDIEPGFEQILSNVFSGVVKLTSIADLPGIVRGGTNYIIQPVIITSSGGSGLFTWPPTNFTVDLTCNIRDTTGTLLASPRVVGTGSAETGERLHYHGIAGTRAMEDALVKMQAVLFETKFGSAMQDPHPTNPQSPAVVGDSDRLAHIKELRDKGLITQEEYEAKRKAIVDAL